MSSVSCHTRYRLGWNARHGRDSAWISWLSSACSLGFAWCWSRLPKWSLRSRQSCCQWMLSFRPLTVSGCQLWSGLAPAHTWNWCTRCAKWTLERTCSSEPGSWRTTLLSTPLRRWTTPVRTAGIPVRWLESGTLWANHCRKSTMNGSKELAGTHGTRSQLFGQKHSLLLSGHRCISRRILGDTECHSWRSDWRTCPRVAHTSTPPCTGHWRGTKESSSCCSLAAWSACRVFLSQIGWVRLLWRSRLRIWLPGRVPSSVGALWF